MRRLPFALELSVALALSALPARAQLATPGTPPASTFSILAYDSITGELGAAVQSRVFSVGKGAIWGEAGVGLIATQAYVNAGYGPRGLELLRAGLTPEQVIARLLREDLDPQPVDWPERGRQLAVMDARGNAAAHTGEGATWEAGHRIAPHVSVQGNLLVSPHVLDEMVRAYQQTSGHLSLRLMAALDAGQAAGGDRRGMQSAAMLVVKENGGVWMNDDIVLRLQVDDSPQPLAELRRLVELAALQRASVGIGR